LCIDLHNFLIRPLHKEAIVTLAMLHIDRARTRMPLVCSVVSMLVLALVGALGFISWLLETNNSAPDFQGAQSARMLQTNIPVTDATDASDGSDGSDPFEAESWVRHGREF
jgi:nitrate reductase NapE component